MHITATMHKRLRKKPKKYYVNFALVILQMRGEWNFQEYNKTHKHSGNAKWKKKEKIHIKQETHWMYPTWRCFRTSFSFFSPNDFWEEEFKRFTLYIPSTWKFDYPLWFPPYPWSHDLDKLESTPLEDASIQDSD